MIILSNLPVGIDSSVNSTQIDYSKIPRKRDPKTGTILFQFTKNGPWLTSAPSVIVENVRDLPQILAAFDKKVMGHEGEFNYSTGRMSYPEAGPTTREIEVVKKSTPDQLISAIETVRVSMWSRQYSMESQRMFDLQSWIVRVKNDEDTKARLLLQQRQKEAASQLDTFYRTALKNTFTCECGRMVAKETVKNYIVGADFVCPGCSKKVPKGETL